MKRKITYFLLTIFIVIIGILSRKIDFIPLFIGDVLYAVLIYFVIRFLYTSNNKSYIFIFSLLFCFSIEILQLVQADWLIEIRKSTLGHYILGQGFLWTDLICYIMGVLIAYLIDLKYIKTQNLN